MPAGLTKTKRKRGGQKGNQNAHKHGFYSSALTPDEISRYWHIVTNESIDPEMAVLRVKLQSLISQSPVSSCVLREVVRLIVKWSAKKYHLDRSGSAAMKAAVEEALERSSGISIREPESFPKITENQKNETRSFTPGKNNYVSQNESPMLVLFESQRNTFGIQPKCTPHLRERVRL